MVYIHRIIPTPQKSLEHKIRNNLDFILVQIKLCKMHLFTGSGTHRHVEQHVKLVVLGASQVGKSAVVQQALSRNFPSEYRETIEEQLFYQGDGFLLEITDTSGSYNFPEMMRLSIGEGDVFLLVFSVTDWPSFDRITRLRQQIIELRGPDVPMIVIGNKTDLIEQREIAPEVVDSIVTIDWEAKYHETSAKSFDQVAEVFRDVFKCFPALYGERLDIDGSNLRLRRSASRETSNNDTIKPSKSKLRRSLGALFKKLQTVVER
ncbi:GTP-binding protein Di-Ras1-like [Mya arenaria]|uniref:GTP-binding protein Di-Ras1-like n=1 Tax=Mya arenaria TaxID=6604 RepID=UPI0022E3B22C|nr:GTP-binding protein Di-Ras1-like [Mya arenaria]